MESGYSLACFSMEIEVEEYAKNAWRSKTSPSRFGLQNAINWDLLSIPHKLHDSEKSPLISGKEVNF